MLALPLVTDIKTEPDTEIPVQNTVFCDQKGDFDYNSRLSQNSVQKYQDLYIKQPKINLDLNVLNIKTELGLTKSRTCSQAGKITTSNRVIENSNVPMATNQAALKTGNQSDRMCSVNGCVLETVVDENNQGMLIRWIDPKYRGIVGHKNRQTKMKSILHTNNADKAGKHSSSIDCQRAKPGRILPTRRTDISNINKEDFFTVDQKFMQSELKSILNIQINQNIVDVTDIKLVGSECEKAKKCKSKNGAIKQTKHVGNMNKAENSVIGQEFRHRGSQNIFNTQIRQNNVDATDIKLSTTDCHNGKTEIPNMSKNGVKMQTNRANVGNIRQERNENVAHKYRQSEMKSILKTQIRPSNIDGICSSTTDCKKTKTCSAEIQNTSRSDDNGNIDQENNGNIDQENSGIIDQKFRQSEMKIIPGEMKSILHTQSGQNNVDGIDIKLTSSKLEETKTEKAENKAMTQSRWAGISHEDKGNRADGLESINDSLNTSTRPKILDELNQDEPGLFMECENIEVLESPFIDENSCDESIKIGNTQPEREICVETTNLKNLKYILAQVKSKIGNMKRKREACDDQFGKKCFKSEIYLPVSGEGNVELMTLTCEDEEVEDVSGDYMDFKSERISAFDSKDSQTCGRHIHENVNKDDRNITDMTDDNVLFLKDSQPITCENKVLQENNFNQFHNNKNLTFEVPKENFAKLYDHFNKDEVSGRKNVIQIELDNGKNAYVALDVNHPFNCNKSPASSKGKHASTVKHTANHANIKKSERQILHSKREICNKRKMYNLRTYPIAKNTDVEKNKKHLMGTKRAFQRKNQIYLKNKKIEFPPESLLHHTPKASVNNDNISNNSLRVKPMSKDCVNYDNVSSNSVNIHKPLLKYTKNNKPVTITFDKCKMWDSVEHDHPYANNIVYVHVNGDVAFGQASRISSMDRSDVPVAGKFGNLLSVNPIANSLDKSMQNNICSDQKENLNNYNAASIHEWAENCRSRVSADSTSEDYSELVHKCSNSTYHNVNQQTKEEESCLEQYEKSDDCSRICKEIKSCSVAHEDVPAGSELGNSLVNCEEIESFAVEHEDMFVDRTDIEENGILQSSMTEKKLLYEHSYSNKGLDNVDTLKKLPTKVIKKDLFPNEDHTYAITQDQHLTEHNYFQRYVSVYL